MAKKKTQKKKIEKEEKNEEIVEESPDGLLKKKVIYTEIDDEITMIYDKIRPLSIRNIYIVVPERAKIFQSIVNLKILKRKADEDKKKLYFITNDKNGIYLARQIGIEVYDKVNSGDKPSLFSTRDDKDELSIKPLTATVNSVSDESPTRLAEKKLSISEMLRRKKGKKKSVSISKIGAQPQRKKSKMKNRDERFLVVSPNRHALIGLVAVSLCVLLIIVYIALPGVTIHMTPAASVLEKSVNITLADFDRNTSELETRPQHMIASFPVNTTRTSTINHFATGKKFSERATNASGTITVINKTNSPWPLVTRTRFEDEKGIVFRVLDGVTVPPAGANGPGVLEVYVEADPEDAYGVIVGERGNIEPSTFFLPGLREDSRAELYGESHQVMTGGVTDYIAFVTAEDIQAAEEKLKLKLEEKAVEDMRAEVDRATDTDPNGQTYQLLEGEGALRVGEFKINVPRDLEGKEMSEFTLTGEVRVSGVYYDHDVMIEILKAELLLKKSPQKELLRINEDSSSYRIFEWDNASGKVRLTANIKGIEQFDIDPEKESGQRLLSKIREHISGAQLEDAKTYIQNLPQINKVEIESWPVWAPTIPNLTDNIEFEVKEAFSPQ